MVMSNLMCPCLRPFSHRTYTSWNQRWINVVEVDTMLVQRRVSSGLSRIQNESLSFEYWRLLTYFIHCELWIAGAIPNSQWIKITHFYSKNMNVIIICKGKLRASSFRWIVSLFYKYNRLLILLIDLDASLANKRSTLECSGMCTSWNV